MKWISSGAATGSVRNSTAFMRLKIAVLAPMPSASVAMAAQANPGVRRDERTAYLTS